ncbi:MAG: DNRLRE domain-containing protein, partial [Ruminococcaceae bacterium]|nr:DNRLRE domain-containing protein [Oscillospiraceae bacterium]
MGPKMYFFERRSPVMKKALALLLALLTLLCSCAPAGGETETVDPGEKMTETESETESETEAGRVYFSIPVKEDAYVMNKDGNGDQKDTNFGSDKEIHLKTNGGSLTRYGYVKFDISELVGDDDFTAIELELTLTVRQTDPGSEFAVIEVYGADSAWTESELTFNKQPEIFNLITTNSTITTQPVASRFSITDYVRKALANGQTEITLYLKEAAPVALHTRFASKEAGAGAPKLSVYYGQKTDDSVYTGLTGSKGPEMSKTGIDTILGWDTVEKQIIPVFEDTYVEAGSSGDKNFGAADIIDFKAMASSPNNYYRIPLLKFDLNDLKADGISAAALIMTCSSIEQDYTPRVINIYSCDPYEWEENTVTYNTLCEKEELITSFTWNGGKGTYPIDITE